LVDVGLIIEYDGQLWQVSDIKNDIAELDLIDEDMNPQPVTIHVPVSKLK
jgi:hypothetical protein